MKKCFLPVALLLSMNHLNAVDHGMKLAGAIVAGATLTGLKIATEWKNDHNEKGILTTVGKPFGLTGRGTLQVLNTAGALTAAGCCSESLRPTAITAGGFGAAALAVQALRGADQENNPVDNETIVRWTGAGAVLATVYNKVPAIKGLLDGLFGRRFGS